jgi:hypothetical protein
MKVKLVKHLLILFFSKILEPCTEKSGGFFLNFRQIMAIENP